MSYLLTRSLACIGLVSLGGCYGFAERSEEAGASVTGTPMAPVLDPSDARPPVAIQDGEGPLAPFQPGPLQTRVLLGWQYQNAVQDLLGAQAAAAVVPPPDTPVNGFDAIGAAQLAISPRAVALYESSARAATAAALSTPEQRSALYGCTPAGVSDASCFERLLSRFGRRAFRRTLSAEELGTWVAVAQEAAAAFSSFDKGAELVLAGMLQAPSFLYVTETGMPDPSDPTRLRLTPTELATRLSLFLTGSIPDQALLDAADAGALDTAEGVRGQARMLLQSPRARMAVAKFFDELLLLRDVPTLTKGAEHTSFTPTLAQHLRQETQTFLEQLLFEKGDFRDFWSADYTYVGPLLAQFYGLPAPPGTQPARVLLPAATGRAGFLGQGAYLALNAHTVTTSPTHRGKFVRERILCHSLPPPPPNVDTSAISQPTATPRTMRERLSEHQQNPACAGCHTLMDNIGLAMEHYDAAGQYRETDSGLALDTAMSAEDIGSFSSPRELGALLRGDLRTTRCLTRNVFRAAVGRVDTEGDSTPLREAHQRFVNAGYDASELIVELVSSPAFRFAAVSP